MSTKYINMSDPKAVAAATGEEFPDRSVPDGEKSRATRPLASLRYKHVCDRMTDKQFPDRSVPDGEKSLRACADRGFSAYPWVTQRRYKE